MFPYFVYIKGLRKKIIWRDIQLFYSYYFGGIRWIVFYNFFDRLSKVFFFLNYSSFFYRIVFIIFYYCLLGVDFIYF